MERRGRNRDRIITTQTSSERSGKEGRVVGESTEQEKEEYEGLGRKRGRERVMRQGIFGGPGNWIRDVEH